MILYCTKTNRIKQGTEILQYIQHQYSLNSSMMTEELLNALITFSMSRNKPNEGIEWYYILKRKEYSFSITNYACFLDLSTKYQNYVFGTKMIAELIERNLFYFNEYEENTQMNTKYKQHYTVKTIVNSYDSNSQYSNQSSTMNMKNQYSTNIYNKQALLSKKSSLYQSQKQLFSSIYQFLLQSNYRTQLLDYLDRSIRLSSFVDDSLFSTVVKDIYSFGEWSMIHEWFTIIKSRYPLEQLSETIPQMIQFYTKTNQSNRLSDLLIELKDHDYLITIKKN